MRGNRDYRFYIRGRHIYIRFILDCAVKLSRIINSTCTLKGIHQGQCWDAIQVTLYMFKVSSECWNVLSP